MTLFRFFLGVTEFIGETLSENEFSIVMEYFRQGQGLEKQVVNCARLILMKREVIDASRT